MKQVCAFLLVVAILLIHVSGTAYAQTKKEYIQSFGVTVIDLADSESIKAENMTIYDGLSVVIGAYNDSTFGNVIIWTEDNCMYCTADVMALIFGGGVMTDANGLCRVFTSFCDAFDFDLYLFTGPGFTYCHPTSIKAYGMANSLKEYGDKKICLTKDGFLHEVTIKLTQ